MVQKMATITKRTNPSGAVVYRAQVRVKREGYPPYSESRTFSKKSLATEWAKRREFEIESNPDLLFNDGKRELCPTLREAAKQYVDEVRTNYSETKLGVINFILNFDIANKRLDRLTRADYSAFAFARQKGCPELGIKPVVASTINGDLQYMRSIIKHAHFVWGLDVSWAELDVAMEGLRRARVIGKARRRDRLPDNDELLKLTVYFLRAWRRVVVNPKRLPMHLIMWFAIYSCRRLDEIARLRWSDFDEINRLWLVRDLKNPRGSKGNDKAFMVSDEAMAVIDLMRSPEIARQMNVQNGDLLLGGYKGRSVGSLWQRACRELKIDDLRFHDLRHEGATRLAEKGLSIPVMQQFTLHGDWESMRRYTNLRARPPVLEMMDALQEADEIVRAEQPDRSFFA